ncbi:hypothetical protein [Parapedobacter sp. DT-150]|uniref:hypothetical protein n=1 Tax=Parapedobacter sp. DT-150 TaxID=3396162 RepID=UPI003F1A7F39
MGRLDTPHKCYFLIGFFLVNVLGSTLVITALAMIVGFSVSYWQFPVAIVLALSINGFLIFKRGWLNQTKTNYKYYTLYVPLLAILFSLLVGDYFFDVSPDGQEYHQEAIIQLHNGWNPYHIALSENTNQAIWINHYAKGMETIQSSIYYATGSIEAGKSTNFILAIAGFFLSVAVMLTLGLSRGKAQILGLLLTLNPVVVNQLLTFYVDGVLASLIIILISALILAIIEKQLTYYLLLAFTVVLAFNVKFTAIVYVAIFVCGAWVWLMQNKQLIHHKPFIITCVLAVISAILIGFNPYVTNTICHGHPLYPLFGPNKVDIMTHNLPGNFKEMSGIAKFGVSLFSHTDNTKAINSGVPELKIPFTLNKIDIGSAGKVDTRLAGFGPLFSGILLLALVLLIFLLYRLRAKHEVKYLAFLLGVMGVSIAIIPEAWWARYVPQLWFIPLVILLGMEWLASKKHRILKYIIYIAIVANISFTGTGIIWNLLITSHIDYQLAQLKASGEVIIVEFRKAQSNRIRFKENNIPYIERDLEGDERAKAIVRSDSRFIPPRNPSSQVKPPFVIRLADRFKMNDDWVGYQL